MRYHNQCISPDNVSYGTTTSVFQLAMCHIVPQPVYLSWQCVIRYQDQCISPVNVLCGTTTSVFHLAMSHAVPRPVQPSNMSYGTTTSVFHLAMFHTIPQPVYFSWQCVMRYHNQRLSHGTKVESSTSSSDEMYFFSDLGKLCDFLGYSF